MGGKIQTYATLAITLVLVSVAALPVQSQSTAEQGCPVPGVTSMTPGVEPGKWARVADLDFELYGGETCWNGEWYYFTQYTVTPSWSEQFTATDTHHAWSDTLPEGQNAVEVEGSWYWNHQHCYWSCTDHPHPVTVTRSADFPVDVTPPLVTLKIGEPAVYHDEWTVVHPTTPLQLNAADGTSGVATVEWAVDGGAWTEGRTFTLEGFEDGPVKVHARVTDVAGHVTEAAVDLAIDSTPPELTLIHPTPTSVTTHPFSVETCDGPARVSDDGAIVAAAPEDADTPEDAPDTCTSTDAHADGQRTDTPAGLAGTEYPRAEDARSPFLAPTLERAFRDYLPPLVYDAVTDAQDEHAADTPRPESPWDAVLVGETAVRNVTGGEVPATLGVDDQDASAGPFVVTTGELRVTWRNEDAFAGTTVAEILVDGETRLKIEVEDGEWTRVIDTRDLSAGEHEITLLAHDGIGNVRGTSFTVTTVPQSEDGVTASTPDA